MKLIILSLFLSTLTFASADLDARLSFKSIVGIVLNAQEEPVHADQIESEIATQLKDKVRFDFSESGYLALKESLKQTQIPTIDALQNVRLESLRPGLAAISALGVKAAVLSYLRRTEEGYKEFFYLVALPSTEIIHKVEVEVEKPGQLESFSAAAKKGMFELMKGIPFDATIVSRDGYRVILDRGADLLRPNQQISAYTIEEKDGNIVFDETGIIHITQVEQNISFGKVTVEKRPKEVGTGNKIRLDSSSSQVVSNIQFLGESSVQRGLATLPPPMMTSDSVSMGSSMEAQVDFAPQFEISKGKVGNVGIDLGAGLVNFETTSNFTSSSLITSKRTFNNNRIYPQAVVRGEIYLTSRVFFEGMYSYGVGRVDAYSTSAGSNLGDASKDTYASTSGSMSAMRMLVGYRVNIFAPSAGPILYVKGGYARQAFSFNEEVLQKQFIDTSFGGFMVSGGVSLRPMDKLQTAFEVSTNIFPGVKGNDEPATGGQEYSGVDVSNVSAYEVALKGSYEITKEVDFSVKGYLQSYGAEFSTENMTRNKTTISSISDNIKGFQAGLSYYF